MADKKPSVGLPEGRESEIRAAEAKPLECTDGIHRWHEDADAEGDTCECGAWYRFENYIQRTPDDV